MTGTKLAVNVFEESKTPEQSTPTPQQNQQPADSETKTTTPTNEGTSQTTSPAPDTSTTQQDVLTAYAPWIAAGIVAVIIMATLFAILRKLNKRS